jgi:hypothetical protein
LHVFLESLITSEHFLGNYPCDRNNSPVRVLIGHEVVNIGLNPVESYSTKITNSIDYLGGFSTEQVGVKKNINIY